MPQVARLYRYPVKGLSAEPLEHFMLTPGEGIPGDRRFALARPETRFDPDRPEWLPKTNFIMLARDEKLAQLRTRFDAESGRLAIERDGALLLNSSLAAAEERGRVEAFFADFLQGSLSAPPRVVEAPGHTFTDARRKPNSTTYKYVSLINLASIRALEEVVGAPVDPIRFRANLYFDEAPAWAELDWLGSYVAVGSVRLRVVSPTIRCAATTVNPATGERDLDIPKALREEYGHIHMGVYAEVVSAGAIAAGDLLSPPI